MKRYELRPVERARRLVRNPRFRTIFRDPVIGEHTRKIATLLEATRGLPILIGDDCFRAAGEKSIDMVVKPPFKQCVIDVKGAEDVKPKDGKFGRVTIVTDDGDSLGFVVVSVPLWNGAEVIYPTKGVCRS